MPFTVTRLAIPDVIVLAPRRFEDHRGIFMETFRASEFRDLGLPEFVQDNQSLSRRRGTIRGLHFQNLPHAQAKLVRVLKGAIFDVAVDMRRGSPTYGRWLGFTLSAGAGEQVFVPRGFAHGFCTLEDDTEVAYRCDDYYAPAADAGIRFSDPDLGIDWPVDLAATVVSDKDLALPLFNDIVSPFAYEAGQ